VDPRRLRIGEWLTGLGGAVLLVSTFLHWYDLRSERTVESAHSAGVQSAWGWATAWEAFSVLDVLLAVLAAMAIGAAVMAAVQNTPAVSLALASLTALVGLFATIAVVFRLIWAPEFTAEGFGVIPDEGVSLAFGAWLGLGGVLLTTLGAFAAMRSERYPKAARVDVPIEVIPPPEGGKA